jgi:hypothetical protein
VLPASLFFPERYRTEWMPNSRAVEINRGLKNTVYCAKCTYKVVVFWAKTKFKEIQTGFSLLIMGSVGIRIRVSTGINIVGISIGIPIEINLDFRRNFTSKLSKVIGISISILTVGIEILKRNRNRNFYLFLRKTRFSLTVVHYCCGGDLSALDSLRLACSLYSHVPHPSLTVETYE